MYNISVAVMTLVTPILNEIITTLITRTLTMRAQSMLIMTMMPIHTCTSIPVIMMDSENSEDVAVNGDTDLDSFGAENSRINNAGIDNADDDIDANEYDDGDADSNDFVTLMIQMLSMNLFFCLMWYIVSLLYTCMRLWA